MEQNIRPAQWLGLLKILAGWGAEWYYTGFFSLGVPFPNPSNWIWQAAMPSYAQAITSQYAELLFSGDVMAADAETSYSSSVGQSHGYLLWAGAMNHVAIARKHKTKEVYLIAATIMRNSNYMNSSRLTANVTINLPGGRGAIDVEIRLQGSVFILDRSNPSAEKLVQLDGWHEVSHPSHWAKETHIQAELCDLMTTRRLSKANTSDTETDETGAWGPLSNVGTDRDSVHGRHHATSFLRLSDAAATYKFPAPALAEMTGTNAFVWLRSRAHRGGSATVSVRLTGTGVSTVQLEMTGWQWQKVSFERTAARRTSAMTSVVIRGANADLDQVIVTGDRAFHPHPGGT